MKLALKPFGLVDDFGENQLWLDRHQKPAAVKDGVGRADAAKIDVGEKFVGAPFGEQLLRQLVTAADHGIGFDFRKALLKSVENWLKAAGRINGKLSLARRGF